MMKKSSFYLIALVLILSSCYSTKETVVKIKTDFGDMTFRLYNQTPLHRDNFIQLAKSHTFDSLLFHRVIKDFMIQGGDVKSKNAPFGKMLGDGDLGYTVPAEFDSILFHGKGALAAARMGDNVNPKRESSASQFYIAQGQRFTDKQLDLMERGMKRKFPPKAREAYKTIGGVPHLDGSYTVFGQMTEGMSVLDSISKVPVDQRDRPIKDLRIKSVQIIKSYRYKKSNPNAVVKKKNK